MHLEPIWPNLLQTYLPRNHDAPKIVAVMPLTLDRPIVSLTLDIGRDVIAPATQLTEKYDLPQTDGKAVG